jgi:hypothetical protein
MLVGFAANAPPVTPVPESGMLREELEAVLAIAMLPVTAPAEVGEKAVVRLVLCPAASVSGTEIPLKLKPVPLTAAWLMVTLVEPPFVKLTVSA